LVFLVSPRSTKSITPPPSSLHSPTTIISRCLKEEENKMAIKMMRIHSCLLHLLAVASAFFLVNLDVVASGEQLSSSFALYNAETDIVIQPQLVNGDVIDLETTGESLTLMIATTTANNSSTGEESSFEIASVAFDLDDHYWYRVENADGGEVPYSLNGDDAKGGYFAVPELMEPGVHTVVATPYAGRDGTGVAETSVSVTFEIIDSSDRDRRRSRGPLDNGGITGGWIRGLALVNANTEAVLQILKPDDIIDLASTGRQLSIRLRRQQRRDYIGSVIFNLDDIIGFSTANRKPFVLGQLPDANADEKFPAVENLVTLGHHSIVARSYTGTDGSGLELLTLALNFTVIDSSNNNNSSSASPNVRPSLRPVAVASRSPIFSPTLIPTLRSPTPPGPTPEPLTRGPTRRPTGTPTNKPSAGATPPPASNPIPPLPPPPAPAPSLQPLPPPLPRLPAQPRVPSGGTEPSDVPAYNASPNGAWTGEMRAWHKLTLGFHGPDTNEMAMPNPFTDYRLDVTFQHDEQGGASSYVVPGYYAADGNAANTHASSGKVWLVHFAPPVDGVWTWTASFTKGTNVAQYGGGSSAGFFDQATGSMTVGKTDKSGRDHRGKGMLEYVGEHHLRFAETGEWFLKAGVDSPENLLAYDEFDNTDNSKGWRKSWSSHIQDFRDGDPTWSGGQGKGIVGAIDYLADMGLNVFSFLTMNINGDDKNVFPYVSSEKEDRMRMDVSKTAQWEVLMEHADKLGLFMHFKLQEYENDQLLDGGALGQERTLYFRELIARFGHHLALNWNMGEENTNTHEERMAFGEFFRITDPYQHPVVVHSVPDGKNEVYGPILQESNSYYVGASLQIGDPATVFDETLFWLKESEAKNQKWIVSNDEQGPWRDGVLSDEDDRDHDVIRSNVLWGNIMAGGSGVSDMIVIV
jgi:Domain of unknown function (DUF5060)